MSKSQVQLKVRQRERFLCANPNCRKSCIGQYAHIIPEFKHGSYTTENIVFLCYECHKKIDYSIMNGQYDLAIQTLKSYRDSEKFDDIISNSFEFLANNIVVKIGNGITLINCSAIFRDSKDNVILGIQLINNRVILNGIFFDEKGNKLLTIEDSKFHIFSGDIWDIKISRNGKLEITNNKKRIFIDISQSKDGAILLNGSFWLDGDIFDVNKDGIVQKSKNNRIIDCRQENSRGIVLSKDSIAF